MNIDDFLKAIQLMLAPSVMISACGLLLLGISNKNSSITNRIRLLNEEKRRVLLKTVETQMEYITSVRLQSIAKQLNNLLFRLRLVRNVIISYTIGIFLFIMSSLVIGIEIFSGFVFLDFLKTVFFVFGMVLVGVGLIFALKETLIGYKIVELEIKADD